MGSLFGNKVNKRTDGDFLLEIWEIVMVVDYDEYEYASRWEGVVDDRPIFTKCVQ